MGRPAYFFIWKELGTGERFFAALRMTGTGVGTPCGGRECGRSRAPPLRFYMGVEIIGWAIRIWLAARNVGATLAVARKMGDEILRCAQNDRDEG